MKKGTYLLVIISFLAPLNIAFAQCAAGIGNTPGCVPPTEIPGHSMYGGGSGSAPRPINMPQPIWEDRWGAIAVDASGEGWRDIAVTVNRTSKSDAERRVLNRCRERGGKDCKVLLSYYNQCGAYAETPGGAIIGAGGAVDRETAGRMAIQSCENAGGAQCEVAYSDCSFSAKVN